MNPSPDVSVVVPLFNEEPNVAPLVEQVRDALAEEEWELILVDDGSSDGTAGVAAEAAERDDRIRLVRLARNFGQTAAMQAGFDRSRGDIVVTMDGDLQNDPRDIPRLLARVRQGCDLAAGYRKDREDAFLTRRVPSRLANALIRRITGVPLRDNGCSLKAYRREVVERLHLYSDLHRFIAPLAAATAGAEIEEVTVRHHPRRRGESKYGLSRTWKVLADLITVNMIRSFRERPLVLFGLLASIMAAAGVACLATPLVVLAGGYVEPLDNFVFSATGLLLLETSVFLLMLGLVAEVALHGRWMQHGLTNPVVREAKR